MVSEPEVIRQNMEATRSTLTEKLECLERQVTETVQDAREAVSDTVDTVRESVQASIETVKESMDLSRQMQRHPWAFFGTAVGLGFIGGWLLNRAPRPTPAAAPTAPPSRNGWHAAAEREQALAPSPEKSTGLVTELAEKFSPEIDKIKGMAIGALAGLLRDAISQSAPEPMQSQLHEVMDQITVKLGGKPIQGPVLESFSASTGLETSGHACARR